MLVEPAGDDRTYEAIINGTAYSVVERVFALYPQESGQIDLSPARFEARVLQNGRITGRKVFESQALEVTVLPAPAPPAEYPNAAWFPARDLQIEEEWSRDAEEVKAGEPLTRHILISALGQLETQIPVIEPPSAEGINVYPDKPDLERRIEAGGIRGERKDQYAMIGVVPGAIELPALVVPWWNVDTLSWEVARLPARIINILPSGDLLPAEPPPTAAQPAGAADAEASPAVPAGGFWRRASEFLAVLWLATLLVWWWSSRPPKKARREVPVPPYKEQARFLKEARKAALAGDAASVRRAMLAWARVQWPDAAPLSIGALAERVSAPLAEELRQLSRGSYGPTEAAWDGQGLARALRSFAVKESQDADGEDILPPLMPAG